MAKKLARARMLATNVSYGLPVGCVVEADPALINQLQTAGDADPHPNAVAYALKEGAKVIQVAGGEDDAEAEAKTKAEAEGGGKPPAA